MHDLLIALAFIGMVIAPAIVATNSHIEASDDSSKRRGWRPDARSGSRLRKGDIEPLRVPSGLL